jgi:hypothetical protein
MDVRDLYELLSRFLSGFPDVAVKSVIASLGRFWARQGEPRSRKTLDQLVEDRYEEFRATEAELRRVSSRRTLTKARGWILSKM